MQDIVVVTDEALMAAGIRAVLAESREFRVRTVVSNLAQLPVDSSDLDLVLYCLEQGADPGPLLNLCRTLPHATIVVLSRDPSPELAHICFEAGVRGMFSTTARAETLQNCLTLCTKGQLWVDRALTSDVLRLRPIALSRRQIQLVRLLTQGLKNKEIASAMGISEGTVKAYLSALFEKVGAKDRFDLALYGLKHLQYMGSEDEPRKATRSAAAGRTRAEIVA